MGAQGRPSRNGSAPIPVRDNVLLQCDPSFADVSGAGGETGGASALPEKSSPREGTTRSRSPACLLG